MATSVLGKSFDIDAEDSGDYLTPGGLDIGMYGEYVKGDRGCQLLLEAHGEEVASFAYISMANESTELSQQAESYATVAEAERVMQENAAQARTCKSFTMTMDDGDVAKFSHKVEASSKGDVDVFLHKFVGKSKEWIYEFQMFEGRVGGEMMHMTWSTTTRTDPSVAAWDHFLEVIGAYREKHPRPGAGETEA